MYSIDEIKELLVAFDASKATAVDICLGENECISIRQKNEKSICMEDLNQSLRKSL